MSEHDTGMKIEYSGDLCIKTVHTNYEIGFGSCHTTPEVEYADMGFGAPFEIQIDQPFDESLSYCYRNVAEQGHGDPYGNFNIYIDGDKQKFSDDGGEIAILRGDFQDLLPGTPKFKPIGPFQVDFISVSDGTRYKSFSGVPQKRRNLFTTINQNKMHVCLPVMPKGLYNVEVFWGEGFVNKAQITSGIEIIHRNRFDKALAVRNNLPRFYNVGELSDNIVPSQDYKKESNIAVLTKAFAEICEYGFPNAYTVLTQKAERDTDVLHVETTLRYPESGIVYADGEKITYTGKTNTTFTGCTGVRKDIIKNTRVESKERDYAGIPNFTLRRHDDLIKPRWPLVGDSWEGAFNVMHLGERAAMPVNFNFFYYLFQNIIPKDTGTYNSADRTLSFVDPDFLKEVFTQKYCRIGGKTYHIEKVNLPMKQITLTEYGCSYWHAAPDYGDELQQLEIEILPFWIRRDEGGLFRVEMEGSIFREDLGFIDKDYIDLNIYLGDADVGEQESALLRHLAAGVKGEVLRRRFYGGNWPLTINQDIRSPLLVIEPSRDLA